MSGARSDLCQLKLFNKSMRLLVIACFTRLKVLRLDPCLLFRGCRDLRPPRKEPVPLVGVSQPSPNPRGCCFRFYAVRHVQLAVPVGGGEGGRRQVGGLFLIYCRSSAGNSKRVRRGWRRKHRRAAIKERRACRRWLEQPAFYCMLKGSRQRSPPTTGETRNGEQELTG